mmetsp:Transcript_26561/g.41572  ORF Transcript_26561/g.41572 Transcript_26561/m.41572 type:complete len:369 (+) Transcript_26561:88-1194(+)|eukprot:CAMPEP_0184288390 /NCGR_PEP_ID=MMETSP1049-20130417/918_1 /TAXON_ID=77928 /ORGANISM="Proteomonas sulcata, Strain CCMP704" /LENGTH=368 /DNA_ID=CAMNT_0026594765 /DNA_START=51 /DNA_END=1157 /DNA_ORIENTATION=-
MEAEAAKRESVNSNFSQASDEDWEIISDALLLHEKHDPATNPRPSGPHSSLLNQAGDWIQWGLDEAAKGVEFTYDNIHGLLHYKKLRRDRRDALELASRQQWQLMQLEQKWRKERDDMSADQAARERKLEDKLAEVARIKEERDKAETRLKAQSDMLDQVNAEQQEKNQALEELRREAEKRAFQEAAALSALEELRVRQQQEEEEARAKTEELEAKEEQLRVQQEDHRKEILRLREQLLAMEQQAQAAAQQQDPLAAGEEDYPDEFYCPITMELMENPVMAADGFTYERRAIQDWFDTGNLSSPKTGALLKNKDLFPNLSLRSLISDRRARTLLAQINAERANPVVPQNPRPSVPQPADPPDLQPPNP